MSFYILSLKWTRGADLVWWGPNSSGYTRELESAGVYTDEDVAQRASYLNNRETTCAIACADVERLARRHVVTDHIHELTGESWIQTKTGMHARKATS